MGLSNISRLYPNCKGEQATWPLLLQLALCEIEHLCIGLAFVVYLVYFGLLQPAFIPLELTSTQLALIIVVLFQRTLLLTRL